MVKLFCREGASDDKKWCRLHPELLSAVHSLQSGHPTTLSVGVALGLSALCTSDVRADSDPLQSVTTELVHSSLWVQGPCLSAAPGGCLSVPICHVDVVELGLFSLQCAEC